MMVRHHRHARTCALVLAILRERPLCLWLAVVVAEVVNVHKVEVDVGGDESVVTTILHMMALEV